VRAAAAGKLAEVTTFLRAQNVAQVVPQVQGLVAYCDGAAELMAALGVVEVVDEAAKAGLFANVASLAGCKESEMLSMYRLLLLHYLEDLNVDEAQQASLASLRTLLGLRQAETESVYQAVAGPLFRKAVKEATAGALGEGEKAQLQAVLAGLALPEAVTSKMSVEVYEEKLAGFGGEGKIISEEQSAELAALRAFLGLDLSQVADAHEATCGATYANSCKEVMGVSGNIPDEYFAGLDKLRERLALTPEVADKIFASVAQTKMKTIGDKAVEQLEAKAKAQQNEQKRKRGEAVDAPEDGEMGGMGDSLSAEIVNLVEFASAARILKTETVDGKEASVASASLRGEIEDRMIKELYRQFLVEAFSSMDPQSKLAKLASLGPVLGLTAGEVAVVHEEIGATIYRQYLGKALQKGPVGAEEEGFLSQIKDTLDLDGARCDELVREMKVGRVTQLVENLFSQQVTPKEVTEMRDTASMLEVDLVEDAQVLPFRLEKMFAVELEALVEAGEVVAGDLGALEEVCDSLHISEEKASQVLTELIQKKASGGLLQASALFRQDRNEDMVAEIEGVLRYASLMPCEVSVPGLSPVTKQEMYLLYSASLLTDGAIDELGEAKLELLKATIGLEVAA